LQASIQRRPGGSAVSHHMLAAYQRSYVAVMKSQFSSKGVQGGREARRTSRTAARVRIMTDMGPIPDETGGRAAQQSRLTYVQQLVGTNSRLRESWATS